MPTSPTADNLEILDRAGRGLDRRTILKGAAWATPVILLATAAPAAAQSVPPAPYAGPAMMAIGVGASPQLTDQPKIYGLGDGAVRGTGNLAPGVRFGSVGGQAQSQIATIRMTSNVTTPPTVASLFEQFGPGISIAYTSSAGTVHTYTATITGRSGDPRSTLLNIASFTIRTNPANCGTYLVTSATATKTLIAEFTVNSFSGAATDTRLSAQPSY